jgi:hypothetical protein
MSNSAIVAYLCLLLAAAFPAIAAAEPRVSEEEASGPSIGNSSEKLLVGETEDIMLLPWAVKLPARIDTGATLSSLDARDIRVQDNVAEFVLDKRYGGLRLRVPIIDWVEVRSSAAIERKPVVEIGICLGRKVIRTHATLGDRSHLKYPFLVGRNVLKGNFLVDASRANEATPACFPTLAQRNS